MKKTYAVINQGMKANELRIGNWVRYCDNNYQIEQIIKRNGKYALIFEDLYHGVWIDEVEKIELTEDVLLKCGFERLEPNHDEYPNGGYDLRTVVIYRKDIFTYNTSHGWWINGKHMYSKLTDMELHQLQNLYFAITKKRIRGKAMTEQQVEETFQFFFGAMNDHIAYTKSLRYRMRMKKKPIREKEVLNRLNKK